MTNFGLLRYTCEQVLSFESASEAGRGSRVTSHDIGSPQMESSLEKVKATACNNRSLSAFFALAICTLCLPPKFWISLANFARFHACMRIKTCKSHIVKLLQRKYFFSLSCVGSSICLYLFILTRWRPQAFAGNTITQPVIRCLSKRFFREILA